MDPDSPECGTAVGKEGISTPCEVGLSGVSGSMPVDSALFSKVPLDLLIRQVSLPGFFLNFSWILFITIKDGMHGVDYHHHPVPEQGPLLGYGMVWHYEGWHGRWEGLLPKELFQGLRHAFEVDYGGWFCIHYHGADCGARGAGLDQAFGVGLGLHFVICLI